MMRRPALQGATWWAAWIAAVVLAVAVGVLTVTVLASSMKDRGPIGEAVATEPSSPVSSPASSPASSPVSSPAAAAPAELVRDTFAGEFGEYEVGCDGVRAWTIGVRPAQGWREVSREAGPDDDVDAVFSDGTREAEVTVFCNRGTPTLDEIEFDTLGGE